MCFYIRNNAESATLWVAKKDIVCYKVVEMFKDRLYSAYYWYKYELNKLNSTNIGRRISYNPRLKTSDVYKDGHVYLQNNMSNRSLLISIERGFHSYSSIETAKKSVEFLNYKAVLVKCIIPKGAEFYHDNVDKEYLSNMIIVKKIIYKKWIYY